MIAWRDGSPKRRSSALVNQSHDRVAVNCRRNGLPEFYFAKPLHFPRQIRRCLFSQFIQIEEKEIEFEPGAGIGQDIAMLLAAKRREILCAQPTDQMGFTGLQSLDLRVTIGHNKKNQLTQIEQPATSGTIFQ